MHYMAPEGSYATEPDGAARTREFRAMVAALHGLGLRVILDVVYNHTFHSGAASSSSIHNIKHGLATNQCVMQRRLLLNRLLEVGTAFVTV